MTHKKYFSILLLFLLFTTTSNAEDKKIPPVSGPKLMLKLNNIKKINEEERKLIKKSKSIKEDQIGFFLYDMDNKKILSAHNHNKFFVPGSVAKILMAITAFEVLGPHYRFYTKLGYTGTIEDGILEGDLYLIGEGDPLLKTSDLMNIVQSLSSHKIKQIKGHFYFIDSFFYYSNQINHFMKKDKVYNPGISSLSLNFNRLKIWRYGSRRTSRAKFSTIPLLENFEIKKERKYFPLGIRFKQQETGNKTLISVSRRYRYRRIEEIPARYPSKNTAETFRFLAKSQGINLPSPRRGTYPKEIKILKKYPSKTLKEIINLTLEYSNNLLAESICLTATSKIKNEKLSIEESGEIMIDWFKKKLPLTDWNLAILTGSGLDPINQITPKLVVSVLNYAFKKNYGGHYFISLLPISGQRGSLRRRLNDPDMAYKVWAKTGSLDYVNSLSGYLFSDKGKRLAFTIFINDFEKREKINVIEDTKETMKIRGRSSYWRRKAVNLIDNILRFWVDNF